MAGDSSGAASALSMLLRLRDQAELSQVVFCGNRLKFMIFFDFDVCLISWVKAYFQFNLLIVKGLLLIKIFFYKATYCMVFTLQISLHGISVMCDFFLQIII